jgi:hypothetical protein
MPPPPGSNSNPSDAFPALPLAEEMEVTRPPRPPSPFGRGDGGDTTPLSLGERRWR